MKILWVKAGGLVPPDTGGKIRSYNILRQLARKNSVTFFSFYAAHANDQHPALNDIFHKAICLPLDLPDPKSAGELLDYGRYLFSLNSYSVMKYCRPQVLRELNALLRQERFDVILCDFLFAAPAIPWDFPCPKVLFTHNVEAMIWKRHYQVARNPLWKALSWREWKTMERAERLYLKRADHVLAVSETDRDHFLNYLPPSKLTIIPTGVDVEFFQPRDGQKEPDSLVFTGSMDWLPNEDGIFYFVEQVLPRIREQIPEVSLWVVGRKPSPRLKELGASKGVHITGWVEDIRPYLARSAICIVPLRIGGGTRLKIFEAMAMAKAVVSTTIGAEGLPVRHGESIVLADDPEDFARQTVALLRSPERRKQIAAAAHKMVTEKNSWAKVADGFAEVLEQVSGSSKPKMGEIPSSTSVLT
jgi:sugar transferase (PEP-CTERM/EpsH1 system associated)